MGGLGFPLTSSDPGWPGLPGFFLAAVRAAAGRREWDDDPSDDDHDRMRSARFAARRRVMAIPRLTTFPASPCPERFPLMDLDGLELFRPVGPTRRVFCSAGQRFRRRPDTEIGAPMPMAASPGLLSRGLAALQRRERR